MLKYNFKNKQIAKKLRKEMTAPEKKLWQKIRRGQIKGLKFYRQKPIGDYVVDFYCPKTRLVIELDGDQHFYGKTNENDKARDSYLKSLGLFVLRIGNYQILKNIESVVEEIYNLTKSKNN